MEELITYIKDFGSLIAILSVFVEVSPIKVNPLSYLFKKFGKAINADVNSKIDKLTDEIDILKSVTKETRRKELKIHISNFASDLRHSVIKSESQFIAIIELCDEYLENKWNSKVRLDAQFIKDEYLRLGKKVKKNEIYMKEGE